MLLLLLFLFSVWLFHGFQPLRHTSDCSVQAPRVLWRTCAIVQNAQYWRLMWYCYYYCCLYCYSTYGFFLTFSPPSHFRTFSAGVLFVINSTYVTLHIVQYRNLMCCCWLLLFLLFLFSAWLSAPSSHFKMLSAGVLCVSVHSRCCQNAYSCSFVDWCAFLSLVVNSVAAIQIIYVNSAVCFVTRSAPLTCFYSSDGGAVRSRSDSFSKCGSFFATRESLRCAGDSGSAVNVLVWPCICVFYVEVWFSPFFLGSVYMFFCFFQW